MTAFAGYMPRIELSFRGLAPFKGFMGDDRGVSEEAAYLQKAFSFESEEDINQTITYRGTINEIYQYFNEILEECLEENWDGFGAQPFDIYSFFVAAKFFSFLPENIPKPEINVDPDGEVALEWFNGSDRMLSISFSKKGVLSYAGLFGINKAHGKEYFDNDLPGEILEKINRVFLQEN